MRIHMYPSMQCWSGWSLVETFTPPTQRLTFGRETNACGGSGNIPELSRTHAQAGGGAKDYAGTEEVIGLARLHVSGYTCEWSYSQMQSHSMRRDSHPTASKGKAKLGAQRNNKERLLTGSHHIRSYGSVVCSEARQTSMVTEEVSAGNLEVQNLRRLTAREVTLPPVKWYRQIRIPGITTKWSSPYSNAVHTTKYTILNFLFKNLWEQFHRVANIYFLFVALLNFVPAVEAFAKEIGFIPLLFVLTVTAVKDIFEDYRRYKSDKEVNSRITKVYDW